MSTARTTPTAPKFIAYTRVSTQEQGDSGLGLEAQTAIVRQFVAAKGGTIVREFSEIASGDDDHRPALEAALKMCRRTGAQLIVSKLDRLSRAVALISGLMRQGFNFVVAECAGASTLELHVRAIVAQEAREKIATNTREALAALKARGAKLGSARPGHWKGREDRRQAGQHKGLAKIAAARREASRELYADAAAIAAKFKGASLRTLADELNAAGLTTPRGSGWTAAAVSRMLQATA